MRGLMLAWLAEESKVPDFFKGTQCSGMCDMLVRMWHVGRAWCVALSEVEYGWKRGCHFVTPGGLARLL